MLRTLPGNLRRTSHRNGSLMKPKIESWIFLRGLARSTGHWGSFLETFQSQFPDADIETLDLAGNGSECERTSFLSIAANVDDLRMRSRLLREGRTVSLCSISMGSMLAADWAARYPAEISRVVCINTSDRKNSSFYERMRPSVYTGVLSLIGIRDPLARERKVLKMTTRLVLDGELEKLARKHAKMPQTSKWNFFRQLWAATTYSFPTSAISPTCLFLVSRKDAFVNPICSFRLAKSWNCPIAAHPDASHDLPTDDPGWICTQIQEQQTQLQSS